MKRNFEKYLIGQGYKEYTPSGNKSTVYDYSHRIDVVCQWEHIDWDTLAQTISIVLPQYEIGGCKEQFGAKSHNSVRCALRCFQDFINSK